MSTTIDNSSDYKQQSVERKDKDDMKLQASLSKKESAPTGIAGGVIAAAQSVSGMLHSVLPASVADRADLIGSQIAQKIDNVASTHLAPAAEAEDKPMKLTEPIVKPTSASVEGESKKPLLGAKKAEAKVAAADAKTKLDSKLGEAKLDAAKIKTDLTAAAKDAKAKLDSKIDTQKIKTDVTAAVKDAKAKITNATTTSTAPKTKDTTTTSEKADVKKADLKTTVAQGAAKAQAASTGVLAAAKSTLLAGQAAVSSGIASAKNTVGLGASTDASAAPAAEGAAEGKKRHSKRRRGGRGHGARKHKLREIAVKPQESVLDSLGDKAKLIKNVVVEELKPSSSSSSSSTGILDSIRTRASGLVGSIQSTASGVGASISSAASNVMSSGKEVKAETLKANHLEKKPVISNSKPEFDRKSELPALGTPMSPNVSEGPMKVEGKSTGLVDNLKARAGMLKDGLVDKIDNLSMNADDDKSKPMKASTIDKVVAKASAELDSLKAKTSKQ